MALHRLQAMLQGSTNEHRAKIVIENFMSSVVAGNQLSQENDEIIMVILRPLLTARNALQEALRYAEVRSLDSAEYPEVSLMEAEAAAVGLQEAQAEVRKNMNNAARTLQALLRDRLLHGWFNFGVFLSSGLLGGEPREEYATLVVENIDDKEVLKELEGRIWQMRGVIYWEVFLDMLAIRFRTAVQAGRAYSQFIAMGCGNKGKLTSLTVSGCSSIAWRESDDAFVEAEVAESHAQVHARRKRPRGGVRVRTAKQKKHAKQDKADDARAYFAQAST